MTSERAEDWNPDLSHVRKWLYSIAEKEVNQALSGKISPSDIVQQTLLEVSRDFDNFRGKTEAELKAWLKRTLLHNVQDMAGRYYSSAKRDVSREVSVHSKNSGGLSLSKQISALQPTPSQLCRRQERDQQLDDAIAQLNDSDQQVILLRHERDCSFVEIGEELGITAEAARKRWTRALESLKQILEQLDDFSE